MRVREAVRRSGVFLIAVAGLALLSPRARAWVLESSRRPNGSYTFDYHLTLAGNPNSPSGPSWDTAFAQAAAKWNSAAPSLVSLTTNPGAAHDPCNAADGIHTVAFVPDVCGTAFGSNTLAIAQLIFQVSLPDASCNTVPGALTNDGSIHFKDSVNWDVYAGPLQVGPRDFRRVAVHELGHLLGLHHETRFPSIMAPTISDLEDPQSDDLDGIAALYDLGCPQILSVGAGTHGGTLAMLDCADTEDSLPLPSSGEANALVDLYRVTMPSGGTLTASLTSSEFNPVVQILDSARTASLAEDWAALPTQNGLNDCNPSVPDSQESFRVGPATATATQALAPGTYFVVARSFFGGAAGAYTLQLVPEPPAEMLGVGALAALAGLAGWAETRRGTRRG